MSLAVLVRLSHERGPQIVLRCCPVLGHVRLAINFQRRPVGFDCLGQQLRRLRAAAPLPLPGMTPPG